MALLSYKEYLKELTRLEKEVKDKRIEFEKIILTELSDELSKYFTIVDHKKLFKGGLGSIYKDCFLLKEDPDYGFKLAKSHTVFGNLYHISFNSIYKNEKLDKYVNSNKYIYTLYIEKENRDMSEIVKEVYLKTKKANDTRIKIKNKRDLERAVKKFNL